MTDTLNLSHEEYIRKAIAVAERSKQNGNHPFGAILVDSKGTILLEAENTVVTERDCTGHAETNLMRKAFSLYDECFLATCTLYTSAEPCAMCAGAVYWAGVGTVVFGMREETLLSLTGIHPENPTLRLPCQEVFARGSKPIKTIGPVLESEAMKSHLGFWC